MPNLDLGVGALPWRVTAEDKRWLENSSYNRQYSHEFSGMLFSLFCYFISPSLLSLLKQKNKQTNKNANFYLLIFILGSAIASSFIQPWLIFFLQFLFIFLYLFFFFFFLSLIFGLFKPMSSLPWRRKQQPTPVFLPGESHGRRSLVGCSPWGRTESDTTEATWQQQTLFPFVGLWFQNSTIPTGISRTRVKKGYQIAEVGDSWKQSSIKGREFNSSFPLPSTAASLCHVSLAWPTCQNDESPKERVPASEPVPGQVLSPLQLFLSPGQAQQWTGGKSCTGGKAKRIWAQYSGSFILVFWNLKPKLVQNF